MEISEDELKDERHRWLWDNYIKEDLEDLILSLAGEYQGARLIDLCGIWNYNRATVVVELEWKTDIEEIAENFLLEMECEDDGAIVLFGEKYWMENYPRGDDDIPF